MITTLMLGTILTVSGMESGRSYTVQSSTDLMAWHNVSREVGAGQARCFMVDSAAKSRFFRVITDPQFRNVRPIPPRL